MDPARLDLQNKRYCNAIFAWWEIFQDFSCRLLTFFSKLFFQNILSGTESECQMVWFQIRTTFCQFWSGSNFFYKDHEQRTKFAASRQRVKPHFRFFHVKFVMIKHVFVCMFELMLYTPVNNFLLMSGCFLGWTRYKQRIYIVYR